MKPYIDLGPLILCLIVTIFCPMSSLVVAAVNHMWELLLVGQAFGLIGLCLTGFAFWQTFVADRKGRR